MPRLVITISGLCVLRIRDKNPYQEPNPESVQLHLINALAPGPRHLHWPYLAFRVRDVRAADQHHRQVPIVRDASGDETVNLRLQQGLQLTVPGSKHSDYEMSWDADKAGSLAFLPQLRGEMLDEDDLDAMSPPPSCFPPIEIPPCKIVSHDLLKTRATENDPPRPLLWEFKAVQKKPAQAKAHVQEPGQEQKQVATDKGRPLSERLRLVFELSDADRTVVVRVGHQVFRLQTTYAEDLHLAISNMPDFAILTDQQDELAHLQLFGLIAQGKDLDEVRVPHYAGEQGTKLGGICPSAIWVSE